MEILISIKKSFIFILFAAIFTFADDECGIIDVPTTWTKENSPYRITGDIQIAPAARLTLEAGVVVHIVPGEACGETKQLDWSDSTSISIKAYGPIIINGTAEEPVKILPENHIPGKIQWDGIRLPLKERNSIKIEYLYIMGANKAINAFSSGFNVGNSLFMGNNTGIWLENEGDLSVYNCVFTENLSAGIYIKNSRPTIAANIFYKNSTFGIWSDSHPTVRIRNNLFYANADTDCRFCPVGVSKIITTEGTKKDKFENIFSDPIFANSKEEKQMTQKDINVPTATKNVKDSVLQNIYKKTQNVSEKKPSTANNLPFSLSNYSPAINAAPKTDFFKDANGSQGDIGLYGGKSGRYNKFISL